MTLYLPLSKVNKGRHQEEKEVTISPFFMIHLKIMYDLNSKDFIIEEQG